MREISPMEALLLALLVGIGISGHEPSASWAQGHRHPAHVMCQTLVEGLTEGRYLMTVSEMVIQPGETAGPHTRKGPGIQYLLDGTVTGGPDADHIRTYGAGSFWFESGKIPAQWANYGDIPSRILIFAVRAAHEVSQEPIQGATLTKMLERQVDGLTAGTYWMRAVLAELAPGGVIGPHTHRGPGLRYVLTGRLTITLGGPEGSSETYSAGQSYFEPAGTHMARVEGDPLTTIRFIVVELQSAEKK